MKIVESILEKNDCYKKNKALKVKGLMLHSVGVAQPNASVFVKNWNRTGLEKCVHAFIDANTGEVYQTLPWDRRGWHAGVGTSGKSANNDYIGVEMCEPSQIKYTSGAKFTYKEEDREAIKNAVYETYRSAVDLFAELCKKFNLDPLEDGVILSHKEGYVRGIASNHGDPEHIWEQLGLTYTMDRFRRDVDSVMRASSDESNEEKSDAIVYRVRESWDDSKSQLGAYKVLDNAKKTADQNPGYKVYDPEGNQVYPEVSTDESFKVKIEIENLRIRSGPGTDYSYTGKFTGAGIFTIVKIQNGTGSKSGWGLLKSYADKEDGWICLDYATKI